MSSYYMRKSTYQKDYNKLGQHGYDRSNLQKHIDYSKPPPFDDPMWQRGRNESSEAYEDRLRHMSQHMEPDYYRTYEERRAHDFRPTGNETERPRHQHEFQQHHHDHHNDHNHHMEPPPPMDDPIWRRGRNESSEQYDDRLRELERHQREFERHRAGGGHGFENEMHRQRGMGYADGSQTERNYKASWLDRGNLTYRRHEARDDSKFERYRPTQKDYGDFDTVPKLENMPKPYRGQFNKQLDNFQNRVREQHLDNENVRHPVPPPHDNFVPSGNLELLSKPESGVYMLLRAHKNDIKEIERSFQRNKSILTQSGHLAGIASEQISVSGFASNWDHPYIVSVLWFPSASAADKWVDYDPDFKIAHFPNLNSADMVIVPINYIPPHDDNYRTFVLTEYPKVRNPDYFRTDIIEPMREILRDYDCEPFVVRTNMVKVKRGTWLPENSSVTVHRFVNFEEAQRYSKDPRVQMLRGKLNGLTREGRHTTIIFTINLTI